MQAAPNNSFKPNLLRSTNNMAGRACHVVGSATQVGLTQALAMLRQILCILISIVAFLPTPSPASSCVFGSVADQDFASATYVFVFRVLGTEIREGTVPSLGSESGFGRLRIAENLRGNAPFETFSFSAHRGCGSRFVPGHYYVGISSSTAGEFTAGPATVLDLGTEYREGLDNASAFHTFSKLAAAASGKAPLSAVLPLADRLPIEYSPAPPPPPSCGPEVP